ncbi:hypothetical protein [Bacillus timonensis]|nr:hypothetical protein [Bacillus timonensis]
MVRVPFIGVMKRKVEGAFGTNPFHWEYEEEMLKARVVFIEVMKT